METKGERKVKYAKMKNVAIEYDGQQKEKSKENNEQHTSFKYKYMEGNTKVKPML